MYVAGRRFQDGEWTGSTFVERFATQVFGSEIEAIPVLNRSFSGQQEFLEVLRNAKWTGNLSSKSYCLAFGVAEDGQKKLSTSDLKVAFDVGGLEFSEGDLPVLVVNGRIFRSANLSDLEIIIEWNRGFVENVVDSVPCHSQLARFYVSTLFNDWRASRIERASGNFTLFDRENFLFHHDRSDAVNLSIVINPFSRAYQRLASILSYLSDTKVANVQLVFNPQANAMLSITTFFSYYQSCILDDHVTFRNLNDTTVYSAMMDVPHSWIVESLNAEFDLDNILLTQLSPKVHSAEYFLSELVVEGHCRTGDGASAQGAVLRLGAVDTIVMKRGGYYQLRGSLGAHAISLVHSHFSEVIQVNSFAAKSFDLRVPEVPKKVIVSKGNVSRVDVFSVASGHLYERLLKIMMLSVRRHSESHVTFWILKNFLSPQFKASLPEMATKYKFNYRFVYYKWPTWVVPQREKQRIIWGNKILFLDVLFPADLDRVIYVDADQIVRTDLRELMVMDFEKAPYAFTPFCDSRAEMEPYRFWKRGSWAKHLKGRKYHISALFAIDLVRFREMAAGDFLRSIYDKLVFNEGSLANLDQDLPNYVQSQLPIYSLPQEWLWCETWCSDASMDKAKTIDLCNNPLTKVPKLQIAQTRVKEWPALDEEVSRITAAADDFERVIFG
jgi:UDP-glucose:glycoprotein glucosyltransferase